MNPWFAKAVILAANVALIAIRAPHGHRSRSIKVAKTHRGALETALLSFAWVAYFVPLVWVASPALAFAEYPLHFAPLVFGSLCYALGLWVFYRSHADLGTNWSVTLELRESHRLITHGIYSRIRHPMYTGLWLCSVGQAIVIPNWVAGPSYLVAFALLFACRIRAEERMMLEHFGDEYRKYMSQTKRLVPLLW